MKAYPTYLLLIFATLSCVKEETIPLDPATVGFWVSDEGFGEMRIYLKAAAGYDYKVEIDEKQVFTGVLEDSNGNYFAHVFEKDGLYDIQLELSDSKSKRVVFQKSESVSINNALEFPDFQIKNLKISDWEYRLQMITEDPRLEIKWSIDNSRYQSLNKDFILKLPIAGEHSIWYNVTFRVSNAKGEVRTFDKSEYLDLSSAGNGVPQQKDWLKGQLFGELVEYEGQSEVRYNGSCCDGAPLGMPIYEFKTEEGLVLRLLQSKFDEGFSGAERYAIIKGVLESGDINLTDWNSKIYLGLSMESPGGKGVLDFQNMVKSKSLQVKDLEEVEVVQVVPEMYPKALDATLHLKAEFTDAAPVDLMFKMRFYAY